MVRGHPDYGVSSEISTVSKVLDMGELAARLGSVNVYERSGNVVFIDGFEGTLTPYLPGGNGTGWDVTLNTVYTMMGAQSCRLKAGSDGGKSASIMKRVKPIALTLTGFEISFSTHDNIEYAHLMIQHNTGTIMRRMGIKYDIPNDKIYIYEDPATWTLLDSHAFNGNEPNLFQTTKLVVDLENLTYVRFFLDDQLWDISSYTPDDSVNVSDKRFEYSFTCHSNAGSNGIMYVDNFIITINEPI